MLKAARTLPDNVVVKVSSITELADNVESISGLKLVQGLNNIFVGKDLMAVDLVIEQHCFHLIVNLFELDDFDCHWLSCQLAHS